MDDDADKQSLAQDPSGTDPELESLPRPRRPGRRLTLAIMALTALLSLATAWLLRNEALYTFQAGHPFELGEVGKARLSEQLTNRWVKGHGGLTARGAIRYQRPLEHDSYELARVDGSLPVWVQVLIPAAVEPERFVPPEHFVGRLIPVAKAGLRFGALDKAVAEAGAPRLPEGAWLLIDGESPKSTGWALALVTMLLGFAGFNVWGLVRLLRPVRGL
ncbi:MAG: hypothetical protein JW940_33375 [Polyangiaceae bacterium]|nr:hypothetical protein [Polyangiaceae bacterium]